MTLPRAVIVHRTPARLRLRIPERKGDEVYFVHVFEILSEAGSFEIDFDPRTGSLLFLGEDIDPERLGSQAAEAGLFRIELPAA